MQTGTIQNLIETNTGDATSVIPAGLDLEQAGDLTNPLPLRFWEIDHFFKCPAVGTCLDIAEQKQILKNAKALAQKLDDRGFNVQGKEFGFTESHQIAVDVTEFGRGDEGARILKDNNIICNMNLLPFEPLENVINPAGIRLGVQEMTRFGMKEPEMETIAELIKSCLMDGKYVGDDVIKFRKEYQMVHYSYDHLIGEESAG